MRRGWLVVTLLMAVVLAGCAGQENARAALPEPPAATVPRGAMPAFPPQVSDAGRVVVEVTPLDLGDAEDTLHFQVAMNTHSVELDYDLTQLALLRTDQGVEVRPILWDGGRGGHHVYGVLFFPAVDLSNARWVEVIIRDVAGVPERRFRWELQK